MRKTFQKLQIRDCQHPLDRKALLTLEKTPGLSLLLKKINEYGVDRLLRLQTLGSEFRVSPQNFPKLYHAFREAGHVLGIMPLPDLYLFRGNGHTDSYAVGVEKPLISVNLEVMEWFSEAELVFFLSTELARIGGDYLKYQQMASVMPLLKGVISSTTLGLGGLAANGIEVALYNWIIMSKFTADRIGLLACQDENAAITALMKHGGLPQEYLTPTVVQEFCEQAREFNIHELDRLDKVAKIFSFMEYRYTWTVMRTSELLSWIDDGSYDRWMQWGEFNVLPTLMPANDMPANDNRQKNRRDH